MRYTGYNLSIGEQSLLGKGLNYSLPNTKNNISNFIATIENSINNLNNVAEEEKAVLR